MQEVGNQSYEVSRLVALSDGVFAFAITLLILKIPYPSIASSITPKQFVDQLFSLKYTFLSYLFSFYIIRLFWLAHHVIAYSKSLAKKNPI